MMRIALCDDDTVFLEEFSEFIKMKFALYNCEVKVEIFTNGKVLIERFEMNNVAFDIVFLDINMENIDGFSTAERLRVLNTKFLLLFTTNMEGYATEGYKYEAFRYILKSKLKENLEEAIKKIIMKTKKLTTDEEQIQLKIIKGDIYENIIISKKDIIYFQAKERRIQLKTKYLEYDLLVKNLTKYKKMLPEDNFIIILRSYLINLDYVVDMEKRYFILSTGEKIFLGYSKVTIDAAKKKYMLYVNERL